MITYLLGGKIVGGEVVLICKKCGAPAENIIASTIQLACSKCGHPLGVWNTKQARDAELDEFKETVKKRLGNG